MHGAQVTNVSSYKIKHSLPGGTVIKNLADNTGDSRNVCSIPGSGRSYGVRNGNPLQYSCLNNPMNRKPSGLHTELDMTEHKHIQHIHWKGFC